LASVSGGLRSVALQQWTGTVPDRSAAVSPGGSAAGRPATILAPDGADLRKGKTMATGTITANTISVTWQAHSAFETAATDVENIATTVLDSGTQLTTAGMIDAAGRKFGNAVGLWCEQLSDILNTLKWMTDQLGGTANQMQQLLNNNVDQASALTTALEPSSFPANF
jgi:hypothetical protein